MKKDVRTVKLQSKYRESGTSYLFREPGVRVPWLNVSGNWLQDAGFNVGDPVQIYITKGQLLIKKSEAGN